MQKDTVFDKILRKELPARIVYEDEDVLAFRDSNPQAPVHVLVIPKKKVSSFNDLGNLSSVEVGRFFQGVSAVAGKLGLAGSGYRIVINCGRHAQQTIDYVHAHILGGRQMHWPPG